MPGFAKTFLIIAFTTKCFCCLFAQEQDLPVFKQISHPFMPAITSSYLYFTEDGLMWFSTGNGLASFDGSEIIYHTSTTQANIFGLYQVDAMVEDGHHNLYIGNGRSIVYYNREKKTFTPVNYSYKDSNTIKETSGTAFYFDKNGLVYIGTGSRGMLIYDPAAKKIEHLNLVDGKPDSWIDRTYNTVSSFATHATDSSKLWVGSFQGIYQLDKKTKKLTHDFKIVTPRRHIYSNAAFSYDLLKYIDVAKMDVVNDSTIWFNSWAGGFAHYNTKTGEAKTYLHDALLKTKDVYYGYVIRRFAKMNDGNYLLGIFDPHPGLFNTKTRTVQLVKLSPDHSFDGVTNVTNDRKGNIWLISHGKLYYSTPGNLHLRNVPLSVNNKPGGQQPQLRDIYFDKTSKQYYGAVFHSHAVHVWDSLFNLVKLIPTPVIYNYFTYGQAVTQKITKDGSGRWWTAGWENYVLTPGASAFEKAEKKFPALSWMKDKGEFLDVISDKNGNIFYTRGYGTLFHINHQTLQTDTLKVDFKDTPGIEIKGPSKWYDAARNCVYLMKKKGMAQYNLDTKKLKIIPISSLYGGLPPEQSSAASTLDAKGNIWFMIPKYGVRIIEPETFRCIDSIPYGEKGLIRGDFTAITGTDWNYIFFRSLNGIIIYDYIRERSFLLDDKNGLSSPSNISLLYSNGNLIVGQRGSFEYMNLAGLKNYSFTVSPLLNTIKVDTTTILLGRSTAGATIRLGYKHNSLVFSFSAQEFFFPERIEYAYLLDGADKSWQFTNSFNRKITYSKLKPGKYVFKLKAQITGGNWQGETVEYSITIVPAFWQTGWFKLLCILAAIVLCYYLIRKRIETVRKKEQQRIAHEKQLLELEAKALRAQMNPHFIFNSLNSIKSLINKSENDKAAEYLTTFSKLIRTLFQNSDKREVTLYDELETCKFYTQIEKMRFGDKLDFVFEIDEAIDLKDIKVPALILQPFIENAIWHGLVPKESGGKVIFSVKEKNEAVECMIDDDGIGRELSKQYKAQYEATHQSKGIGLTQSRLELDKLLNDREDTIEIIDKQNEDGTPGGTTIIITFKENGK